MRRYTTHHRPSRYGRRASNRDMIIGAAVGLVALAGGTKTATTIVHHHAPTPRVAAVTSGSERAFIRAVLADLGAPSNSANTTSLAGWFTREFPAWPPYAAENPMSSTLRMPGSTTYNSVGVQNYPTASEGAEATALTLKDGYYPQIVAALRSGTGLCGNSSIAGELLTWSGNGYSEVCLFMSTTSQDRIPELRVHRGIISRPVAVTGAVFGTAIAITAMTAGLRLRLGGMPAILGAFFGVLLLWLLIVAASVVLAEVTRRHHKTAARYAARQGGRGASAAGRAIRRQLEGLFIDGVAWAGPRWHARTSVRRGEAAPAAPTVPMTAPASPSADSAEVIQPEGENMTTLTRGHVSRIAPDRRARRVASRVGGLVSSLWDALVRRALDFDPESEADYLDFLNEDAVGISAYAEAVVEVYEGMANVKGADKQAVAALHDYADSLVHSAEMAAVAKKQFAERYELARESAASGVEMTHDGRFITGEGD